VSRDYPNRNVWLAKRCTPRGVTHGRLIPILSAGGSLKDPGLFHQHRRWKGKVMATGENSYYQHDLNTRLGFYE